MSQRLLGIRLMFTESLQNYRIRALRVELDLAIWHPDDRRHTLPRRVEFANVENLVLQ